jgi:hypothetical protein
VGDGVTLTLRNITLKGTGGTSYYSLVTVGSGGNLILADKAVIYDHSCSGVQVEGGGTFIMSGGEIRGNSDYSGGGVYVAKGGTFIMSGGEIWGNDADSGGGVYVQAGVDGGTFTMSGGEIRGNHAANLGGGVFVQQEPGRTGHFAKTGKSVIYGNEGSADQDTPNTALNGGAAVWVGPENGILVQKRDSTAKKGDNLFYNAVDENIEDSGWDPQS